MRTKQIQSLAVLLVASFPFFSEGCAAIEILIGLLTVLAYGPTSGPYIADNCPARLVCTAPHCAWVGENGSFESGREIKEEPGLDPIRPNIWRPGDRVLKAVNRPCQGQYGLYLHEEDSLIQQAYQVIDLEDLFPPEVANRPRRLRTAASFRFISVEAAPRTFKLTTFTFSGLDPQSFPTLGDPYEYAAQALSVETTSVTVARNPDWFPIESTQMLPPDADVLLVLLEYELTGDLTPYNLYIDGVQIVLDDGPYGPAAASDHAVTLQGEPVDIDVLRNDQDPDGILDPATLRVVVDPPNGTAAVNTNSTITYTPEASFSGDDTFSYVFSDGDGLSAGALVTVTVQPGNRPPVAIADTVTTMPGVALDIDVLANDSDPDGDPLTVIAFGTPANGTTELINNGQVVRYTPNAGFTGTDVFGYVIADDQGAQSNEVEVTVIVQ